MSDQSQSSAVRLQAMALIAAAFVTTGGAVTSAFIQSGWISKPSPASVVLDSPRNQATFLGTIEPVAEDAIAVSTAALATVEQVQVQNRPAAYNEVAPRGHLRSEVRQAGPAVSQDFPAIRNAGSVGSGGTNPPRVLPQNTVSKPLMATSGSWFSAIVPGFLTQPPQRSVPPAQSQTGNRSGWSGGWTPVSH